MSRLGFSVMFGLYSSVSLLAHRADADRLSSSESLWKYHTRDNQSLHLPTWLRPQVHEGLPTWRNELLHLRASLGANGLSLRARSALPEFRWAS